MDAVAAWLEQGRTDVDISLEMQIQILNDYAIDCKVTKLRCTGAKLLATLTSHKSLVQQDSHESGRSFDKVILKFAEDSNAEVRKYAELAQKNLRKTAIQFQWNTLNYASFKGTASVHYITADG